MKNLRLRIAAAIAASSVGIVIACGAALYMASEKLEFQLAHQLIAEEIGFLVARHQSDPAFFPTAGANVQYFIARDPGERAKLPDYLRNLPDGQHEIDIGNGRGERHIAVRTVGAVRYAVTYDIGPYEDRELEYQQFLIGLLIAAVIVALALGYWLARVLTRQLALLAQRVAGLGPEDTLEPLALENQDREVMVVAEALDRYRARILEILRREQDFAANASHELRTPLTAIGTSCQVLLRNPSLAPDVRTRIEFVEEAAGQMSAQVQALLFLAREQALGDWEIIALRECVSDVAASLRAEVSRKGLDLQIAVAEDVLVETNRQALHLVISNLLRNAIAYTDKGFVRVGFESGRLIVRDSGPGIHPGHLAKIFERHYRGNDEADGSGIGLDIVRRISEKMGWSMRVNSVVATGSEFVVALSPDRHAGPDAVSDRC